MQSLDRLIMDELEAMDALDKGFDDELDSFWDDAIDEAFDEASPVRLTRQLPTRPAMARQSLQRSIAPRRMTSRPQARQLAPSTTPTSGGFRSALFQGDPDLLAVLHGQLRLGRPGDPQYPAPIKSQGTGVLKVQQALVQLGYPTGVDGKYGNQTYNTVLNYKRRHGILTETGYLDGIVGSKTIRHLDNALAQREPFGYPPDITPVTYLPPNTCPLLQKINVYEVTCEDKDISFDIPECCSEVKIQLSARWIPDTSPTCEIGPPRYFVCILDKQNPRPTPIFKEFLAGCNQINNRCPNGISKYSGTCTRGGCRTGNPTPTCPKDRKSLQCKGPLTSKWDVTLKPGQYVLRISPGLDLPPPVRLGGVYPMPYLEIEGFIESRPFHCGIA